MVGQAVVEALGAEADARVPLGRPSAEAPQPSYLPGSAVVELSGVGLPCLGASRSSDLDHVGAVRREGRDPVESVAAQIHQPAAVGEVGLQRVQHLARPVLGMAPGDQHRVPAQEVGALEVEVLVGNDVELVALLLHPVQQVQIGVELVGAPWPRASVWKKYLGRMFTMGLSREE